MLCLCQNSDCYACVSGHCSIHAFRRLSRFSLQENPAHLTQQHLTARMFGFAGKWFEYLSLIFTLSPSCFPKRGMQRNSAFARTSHAMLAL